MTAEELRVAQQRAREWLDPQVTGMARMYLDTIHKYVDGAVQVAIQAVDDHRAKREKKS
jgi:hypothetical protein